MKRTLAALLVAASLPIIGCTTTAVARPPRPELVLATSAAGRCSTGDASLRSA